VPFFRGSLSICLLTLGRAGILEVTCGSADLAGGADQHAALQDDLGHSQDSTVQACQGQLMVQYHNRSNLHQFTVTVNKKYTVLKGTVAPV
jgi:hypothetical protein